MNRATVIGALAAVLILRGMVRGGFGKGAQDAYISIFIGAPVTEGEG